MIPAEFDYVAPTSLEEASERLASGSNNKVLSGGMSLIPALKHRLAQPSTLVDIGCVPDLAGIREKRGSISIGARATHASLVRVPELADWPAFGETADSIGDVQVRNRGTIGGSLVHADPAADWPALFLAFDGEARIVGSRGERTVAASDFFVGMLTSAVGADEILTEVRLTAERKRAGSAYLKLRQAASGFAVVGVAAQVTLDRKGRFDRVAIGVTGINAVPFRAASVEARLRGQAPEDATLRDACENVEEADPMEDLHASMDYRRQLLSVYARRALALAATRAAA